MKKTESRFSVGEKVRAKRTIRYIMGQISSDKICRNEVVTIDKIEDNGNLQFKEHADRYSPFYPEDFAKRRK